MVEILNKYCGYVAVVVAMFTFVGLTLFNGSEPGSPGHIAGYTILASIGALTLYVTRHYALLHLEIFKAKRRKKMRW